MKAQEALPRLEEIVDRSGVAESIEALLPVGARRRQLSVRTLLIGIMLALSDHRPAHLVRVCEALRSLSLEDRRRLSVTACWRQGEHDLTYRQTERTYGLVVQALAKQEPDGSSSIALSEVLDRLLEASVQVSGNPQSRALAIDWSAYESFARPPHGPQQRCKDSEGAWGHRTSNHPSQSEAFFGYYLQAATIVKEENGAEVPELVRRIQIASPKHDPPAQMVPAIERMVADGIQIGDLLADSGYSYRAPETFAAPARAAGAMLVIDLHPNDRGAKGTYQGAILCNGNLYCPASPKALLELSPLRPGASGEQAAVHDRMAGELASYKLSPLQSPDEEGYRRLACPAVRGKLRCPLRQQSMTLSHERPTVLGPPEHKPVCCEQQTITVAPSVAAKTRQKHDYPSPAHRRSYARRSAAERTFSRLFDPASNDIARGWCCLAGLTANALMLACVFVVSNIRTADAFAARQAQERRRRERGLPPRRRRRPRRTPQELATADAAPG